MRNQYERMINKYQRQYFENRFREINIGRAEAPYINMLHHQSPIKMNTLIANVIFHKSHTTRAINQMLKDGLVKKEIDQDDKRGYIISITKKGIETAEKVEAVINDWENLINNALSEEERIQLDNMRKKVYFKLKEFFEEENADETNV